MKVPVQEKIAKWSAAQPHRGVWKASREKVSEVLVPKNCARPASFLRGSHPAAVVVLDVRRRQHFCCPKRKQE
jgi:hypothetical protein